MSAPVSVLFVCTGNICRSPTAHGVFETLARREGFGDRIAVDSCGTGDWHAGEPPDERSQKHALARGYDLSQLRARQVRASELAATDHILVMDRGHLASVLAICPPEHRSKVKLFLDFAPNQPVREVPDPYYGGAGGFDHVLDLVELGARGLLDHLR